MQLQISNPISVTDPNVCHTHRQICVHTPPPLSQAMGCASSPQLGVQDLLTAHPRCGRCRCPQLHVIPGPYHLLTPPAVPPWRPLESWRWLLAAPMGWGVALPSPSRAPGATGSRQTGSHQPWQLLLLLQGFSPRYKRLCFFHTSFQAGSFCFKNIVVISWLLLNPWGGIKGSWWLPFLIHGITWGQYPPGSWGHAVGTRIFILAGIVI